MALTLGVNQGGVIAITPTAFSTADELTVVIDGSSYSVQGQGTAADTISAFVAAHAEYISVVHSVLASNGTTVLNLYNSDAARTVTATNGTVAARAEMASAGMFTFSDSDTFRISSATVIVNRSNTAGSAFDVATFTFASASEAVRGFQELESFLSNAGRATANGKSISVPASVAYS